jgi:biotin carboxylase
MTILILGAGIMQRPAIQAAHELGFQVTVVDANPHAPAIPLADDFAHIDLKDRDAVRNHAIDLHRRGELAAVFTAGTDFSAAVAAACEACGLPSHTLKAALNASDKTRMRTCFQKHGVPSPRFWTALPENPAFPLVVKPVDNMGARGCRLVRHIGELPCALETARSASRTNRVIIEEYMEGPEFSVDALVYDGTLTVCGFADRHIHFPPYFIEMGHTMPSGAAPADIRALIETLAKGAAALGLTHGAVKGDLKLTPQGPMIGEIAARLSGGYMSGWTYPYASGCNLTREALLLALGRRPAQIESLRVPLPKNTAPAVSPAKNAPFTLYDVPCRSASAERAWISIPGVVREIRKNCGPSPLIQDHLPRNTVGDPVEFPRNNVQKCGNTISAAPDRAQAMVAADNAVSALTIILETGNEATERFLARKDSPDEAGFPPDAFTLPNGRKLPPANTLPANTPAISALPPALAPFLNTLRDWNHLTLREAISRFDALRPEHPALDGTLFWDACVRGSLQGMCYVSDRNTQREPL